MPKANVFNMAGQQVGEIELSEAVFGIEPNQVVVHEVVKNHLANCRQGTQARSPGVRRAPVTPVRALPVLPSGPTAASCLPPSPATTATP